MGGSGEAMETVDELSSIALPLDCIVAAPNLSMRVS